MLTIKRLISALFVVFFVSYTNVALAVTCYKGTWPTLDSCLQCDKGRFCVGGTCTPSTTGTQTVCEEGKGPSGIGIGVAECANVLRGSTSDAGAKSADDCYRTMNGREYITKKTTQYVPGYYFYEVSDCPSGTTSVCASGTVVSYADIKNSDTYCECIAPEEIVNLRWHDGFGGELPTTSFVNAVNNGYPSTGIVNRALTLPASPYMTQDGLFNGWEYNGGQIYNGEIPADSFTKSGDVQMYANYSDDAMAVDFSNPAATGTLPSLSPDIEYSAADDNTVRLILEKGNCAPVYFDVDEITSPDYPNGIFVGWGIQSSSSRYYAQRLLYFFDGTLGYYCADVKYSEKKLNLEPVFYTPQFRITYNKNADGATGTMEAGECTIGDTECLLSDNAFEYTGYTFSGWSAVLNRRVLPLYAGPNDEIKGSNAYNKNVLREQNLGVLSAGADVVEYAKQITEIPYTTLVGASMLTLTAQWTPNKYTITFNPGTGDGVSAENVDFDSALPETIVTPSRLGYGFSGYYNGSEQYYDAAGARQVEKYTTASDLELTAQWTPNTYTITFNPENGGAATTETATFDAQYPTAPSVAKTGYTFVGWFDSVTGGTQYYTDDGATYAIADDLKLYAQWTPNSFTIIYNGNGATGEMSPTTCTYDKSCFVADNAFTKTDYKFAGWQMTDGTPVAVGADFTNKTAVANGNIILVAQWSLDTLDCQLGKYYNGTDFVECPAGQYCPGTGSVTVGVAGCGVECPAGYNAATGAESQEDCAIYVPAGSYLATARDAAPTDCPLGHHCPGDVIVNYGNTSEIYGCSMYGYADETGLAECKKCPDITKGALIEAAQNSRNDDGVRDSINDCVYAFMFAAPEYVDAWNMTPPDFYDTASPLNQRGFFTVICQYNSDTNDYDTNCYANFVGYCADGYYSPQSQEATTYGDAQNVMYENINLKTLENLPCQPVESDLGFVSPGIDTDAPTSDTNFKSLQQQCKPADNEIGAAMVMTDSRYGFGGSEKTCAAVYQFAFFPGGEKYAPKPNIRGSYVTRCLYNKNTGEYDGGCQTNVIYCDSGYYATVKLSPDSGDLTDKMILRTETVDEAVDRACAPVGDGYYSPGQMQCLIEQNINPEETFVVPEFNQETQQCFMDIQNLGVEYVSQRHVCPDGGLTGTDTAYSIKQCFKSDVKCNDGNGGTGVQTCYYNESAKKYSLDCTECEITQCPAGQYMDNGCVDCPAGQYCPGGTSKPVDCPEHSSSFGGASSCACDSGYELPNGNSNNVITDACSPKTYTITYRAGNVFRTASVKFGTEHTTFTTPYPQTGRTQTGWSVMMPTYLSNKVFGMGETFTYNVTANMDLGPKYRQNQFNLIFQNGGAYNADEYRLPKGVVAEYDRRLPDISSYGKIELLLLESETDAGQQLLVSDGWSFDQKNKAWNYDGTNAENYPRWNTDYGLPIEDGTTVNVYPFWKTSALRCNAGYYIPNGDVGNRHCAICLKDQACPGWKELQVVGRKYGMFKCPDNSTSDEQSAYCTCKEGFSSDGMENGKTKLYPTIEAGFVDQSCKKITLYYNYNVNGGEGTLESTAVEYGEKDGPISGEEIGAKMTRAGYVFVGWGETPKATEPYTDWQNTPMTSSKTLYAIWEPCGPRTYKDAEAAAHDQCTPCPDTHPNTFGDASTDINQCYVECAEQIDVTGGVAFRDNETEFYGAVCTYSRGQDENGNGCVVIDGVCVQTDCEPEYEMKNGRCTPCARKYALSYNPNGNCRVESCVYGYHPNGDKCEGDTIECDAPNADNAQRVWNSATNSFGACVITKCSDGFHVDANACVSDTRVCKIENGIGEQLWDAKRNRWGDCVATRCEPGYTTDSTLTNERWKDCGRCNNMFGIDGDVAVSSYINDECEIATCMYQGEKYILENNECRLICGEYSDETGRRYWDKDAHECVHNCNPGYLQW